MKITNIFSILLASNRRKSSVLSQCMTAVRISCLLAPFTISVVSFSRYYLFSQKSLLSVGFWYGHGLMARLVSEIRSSIMSPVQNYQLDGNKASAKKIQIQLPALLASAHAYRMGSSDSWVPSFLGAS